MASETVSRVVGRYTIHEPFAAGGMAAVRFGRMSGQAGFTRTVAIKQLHASFGDDPATLSTLLDEARLAARIQHPNVASTLDVVVDGTDILLVLEYIHGESLARLLQGDAEPVPIPVALAIMSGALHGLHAAHEATSERGEPLGIVHRDVSPQNIMVGVDGLSRVLDFGIAKARGRLQTTREGQVKGKLAYMAPEQIRLGEVSRRTDVFAAGIVLWEMLTGARLFAGENEGHVLTKVASAPIAAPSSLRSEVGSALDALVLRALDRDPDARFASARALALELEACGIAPASAVGRWVESRARDALAKRSARVADIERAHGEPLPAPACADDATRTATVVEPLPAPRRGWQRPALAVTAGAAVVAALWFGVPSAAQLAGREAGVAPGASRASGAVASVQPTAPAASSAAEAPRNTVHSAPRTALSAAPAASVPPPASAPPAKGPPRRKKIIRFP